jgi:hypothetical protein
VPTTPLQKPSERELQSFGSRAVVAGPGGAILPGGNASDAGGINAELRLPQNIYLAKGSALDIPLTSGGFAIQREQNSRFVTHKRLMRRKVGRMD